PGPDHHEGPNTEPDLASGLHVQSRRRFSKFRRSIPHPSPRHFRAGQAGAMLIIATGIRPVTSLFLIIPTRKTGRALENACQVTAIACSIVARPPRIPDANCDRQRALG